MPSATPCQENSDKQRAQDGSRALPQGWRWARLGEVCDAQIGIVDLRRKGKGRFRYVDIASIDNARKFITQAKWVPCKEAPSRARQILKANDVIVATTRPYLNAVAIVPPELDGQIGSTGFCVLRPIPDLDHEFLFAFVRSAVFIRDLSLRVKGALYPAVSNQVVMEQSIPLPPLPEQKRIAALLNERLATVERAQAAVQAQLDSAKALPAVFLRQAFPRPGEELPPAWKWVCLGEALFRRAEVLHPGGGTQGKATFVGLEHVESGTGVRVGCQTVDVASLTGRKPRFYRGDIVYGYLRPYLNKVWVADFDGLCSVDQYAFRVDTSLASAQFLSAFMRSPYYLSVAPVSTTPGQLPRIRSEEIAVVRVPLPPLPQQNRIGAILNEQIAAAARLREGLLAQLAEIDALPAALLKKAFSGGL